MGQRALFKCDKCGFEAELNLSQPDSGMSGNLEQFYCANINGIATIFLGLDILENVPKYFVCDNCAYNACNDDIEINQKDWYDANIKCRMENLQPLIIISNEGNDNVIYQCPCKNCDGIMLNTHIMRCMWD